MCGVHKTRYEILASRVWTMSSFVLKENKCANIEEKRVLHEYVETITVFLISFQIRPISTKKVGS